MFRQKCALLDCVGKPGISIPTVPTVCLCDWDCVVFVFVPVKECVCTGVFVGVCVGVCPLSDEIVLNE